MKSISKQEEFKKPHYHLYTVYIFARLNLLLKKQSVEINSKTKNMLVVTE